MELDTKATRPPLWVFGLLFLTYLGAHVALLLFVYALAPSMPYFLAETLAIVGGVGAAAAAAVSVLALRRSVHHERGWAGGAGRRA